MTKHIKEIPLFVSYPYEWSFSMLKDAALLHIDFIKTFVMEKNVLDIVESNVQWEGLNPVVCNTFGARKYTYNDAVYGAIYTQFCEMYLFPLLITAHLGIDYQPILRSQHMGIRREEIRRCFRKTDFWKTGVLSEILLPNYHYNNKLTLFELLSLLKKMKVIINKLNIKNVKDIWETYTSVQYESKSDYFRTKIDTIEKIVESSKEVNLAWDLGANDGVFSEILSSKFSHVIAVDSSHSTIEIMYHKLANRKINNITPLIMNLSNISPNQGWNVQKHKAFDQRGNVDLILCLAVIHHLRVTDNIPVTSILDWLYTQKSRIVIEFVDRTDEMFQQLVSNKRDVYFDYTMENFVFECQKRFHIIDRYKLSDTRELFDLSILR